MERANSKDGNGGAKLPIGFRFHPTDEELMVHYLKRKVYSLPLPAGVISDLDVFHSNPWDLPGDSKEKRHFFCQKKSNFMNKCSSSFSTDCGYWKATGKDKQILAPGTNLFIGIKKSFVFYRGTKPRRLKTQWIMHEFCLVGSLQTPYLTQKLMVQVGDWVVCRVRQRKKKARIHGAVNQLTNSKNSKNLQGIRTSDCVTMKMGGNNELGFPFAQTSSSSSSSCSSGITEICSSESDVEAISRQY